MDLLPLADALLDLVDKAGSVAAVVAGLWIILLLPLYFSQRRDMLRLRAWMESEPDHPAADVAASEALLDRAEVELEELLGVPAGEEAPATAEEPMPTSGEHPVLTPAQRVTSERPALTRITMERAALEPHPRWRRFVTRGTQPRVLIAVAVVALLVGIVAIFGSEKLLELGGEKTGGGQHRNNQAISVFVLNGTGSPGIASKVGDNVEENHFDLLHVSTTPKPFQQSVVMYAKGRQKEAERVARALGIDAVQSIDRQTQQLAGDAGVVVIAGEDRVG